MTVPAKLLQQIEDGDCTLFLGAGATRQAKGPVALELAELLADKFDTPIGGARTFSEAIAFISANPNVTREDIDAATTKILEGLSPSSAHMKIPSFCWRAIYTVNFDRLVEKAYDRFDIDGNKPIQDLRVVVKPKDQWGAYDRTKLNLFKLHGCISNQAQRLVMTDEDYDATRKNRQTLLRPLKNIAREHSLLFAGISFEYDDYLLKMLSDLQSVSPYKSNRRMYLVNPSLRQEQTTLLESRNFEIIPMKFGDFISAVDDSVQEEKRRKALYYRDQKPRLVTGNVVNLPNELQIRTAPQVEWLSTSRKRDKTPKELLRGQRIEPVDLSNRNDFVRDRGIEIAALAESELFGDSYVKSMIVLLGPAGIGKSVLATRIAYDLWESEKALPLRVRDPEQLNVDDVCKLVETLDQPVVIVIDDIQIKSWLRKARSLQQDLSSTRVPYVIVTSCQKNVWNEISANMSTDHVCPVQLDSTLSELEIEAVINKLDEAGIVELPDKNTRTQLATRIRDEFDKNLVVALHELSYELKFEEIILKEFQFVPKRAKKAYEAIALFHQHGLRVPDYLLNTVTMDDWDVFESDIVKHDAELVIETDFEAQTGRFWLRTRHPVIAKCVVKHQMPRNEDRVRVYRAFMAELGSDPDDAIFALACLTNESFRSDVGHYAIIREFFDTVIDKHPEDRSLILQLALFENRSGFRENAAELLEWAKKVFPRDAFILHYLGVVYSAQSKGADNDVQRVTFEDEALELFQEVQLIDPLGRLGYISEAQVLRERAKKESDIEKRTLLLAEAQGILRKGERQVREIDVGDIKAEIARVASEMGNDEPIIDVIESIAKKGELKYGALYHAWAVALVTLDRIAEADEIVTKGLRVFPGDERLLDMKLELLEPKLHLEGARGEAHEVIVAAGSSVNQAFRLYIEGVILTYDSQYPLARSKFSDLRSALRRRASRRIRTRLCDEDGEPIVRDGIMEQGRRRRWLKDIDSGQNFFVDSLQAWTQAGKPRRVKFHIGFSFAGITASLLLDSK